MSDSKNSAVAWENADFLTKCWRISLGAVFFGGACVAGLIAGPAAELDVAPEPVVPKRRKKKVIVIYE